MAPTRGSLVASRRIGPHVALERLREVLATDQLAKRGARRGNRTTDEAAWVALAGTLAEGPEHALDRIAAAALSLCDAGSAGISVLEDGPTGKSFAGAGWREDTCLCNRRRCLAITARAVWSWTSKPGN
jgi:hypothetical protein